MIIVLILIALIEFGKNDLNEKNDNLAQKLKYLTLKVQQSIQGSIEILSHLSLDQKSRGQSNFGNYTYFNICQTISYVSMSSKKVPRNN